MRSGIRSSPARCRSLPQWSWNVLSVTCLPYTLLSALVQVGALQFAGEDKHVSVGSLSGLSQHLAICCLPLPQLKHFRVAFVIWRLFVFFSRSEAWGSVRLRSHFKSVGLYCFAPRWVLVEINWHAVTFQSVVIIARLPGNQRSQFGFICVAQNCAAWVGFTMGTSQHILFCIVSMHV